jgi:hypothetical protein
MGMERITEKKILIKCINPINEFWTFRSFRPFWSFWVAFIKNAGATTNPHPNTIIAP